MGTPDWSAMGLTQKKPQHRLFDIRMDDYQQAVDWLKRRIATFGYFPLEAVLDPEAEMWRFQIAADMVVNIPHEMVQRVENTLEEIHLWEIRTEAASCPQ